MTAACMGGWACTLRDTCPHYHATDTAVLFERLCEGPDGCALGADSYADVAATLMAKIEKVRIAAHQMRLRAMAGQAVDLHLVRWAKQVNAVAGAAT